MTWHRSGIFTVNFENIYFNTIFLVFLLLNGLLFLLLNG